MEGLVSKAPTVPDRFNAKLTDKTEINFMAQKVLLD